VLSSYFRGGNFAFKLRKKFKYLYLCEVLYLMQRRAHGGQVDIVVVFEFRSQTLAFSIIAKYCFRCVEEVAVFKLKSSAIITTIYVPTVKASLNVASGLFEGRSNK
jgi:hypothetical protein